MKRLFVWVLLMMPLLFAGMTASGQEEQYLQIYSLIQEADGLRTSADPSQALPKYLQAQTALQRIQRNYPAWNPNVVSYRLNYLSTRISELTPVAPVPAPPPAVPSDEVRASTPPVERPASDAAPATSELQAQLAALREQVQQLQSERAAMESRLREALAAQPAVLDPRELANAEERIRSLEKENDLLRVNLAERLRSSPAADSQAMADLKEQLESANRQLTERAGQLATLTREKQALEQRMESLATSESNAASVAAVQQELNEAKRRLTEQSAQAERLAGEKQGLETRLSALTRDAEAAAALRAENEILKGQLAQARTQAGPASRAEQQLAEAQAQIATLQSEKEILRLERIALEGRVKQLSSAPRPAATSTAAATPARTMSAADAERLRRLESERDDLQKRLTSAERELSSRSSRAVASRVADLTGQLDVLRTRLQVLEAQRVPYTEEELALFQKPEAPLADPRAGRRSARELPAGTATLVAEAQRDFSAGRFDLAEEKYQQVLRRDDRNVTILANLATIQMEMDRLDDADRHIQRAIASAPDDPHNLLILGTLRFRQKRLDDALDVLSRAARLDPRNAEIQATLGMVLGERGMRVSAETALRRAIQLDPHFAKAHHNLAVIYATQQPPALELARLHYRKAREAGMTANPELEKMLNEP